MRMAACARLGLSGRSCRLALEGPGGRRPRDAKRDSDVPIGSAVKYGRTLRNFRSDTPLKTV